MPDTAAVPPQPPPRSVPRAPERNCHTLMCDSTACGCWLEGLASAADVVGPLEQGSVVVHRGHHDSDLLGQLAAELARVSGHHQFVVVNLPAGTSLDVVHDPQAVADLLGPARPNPPGFPLPDAQAYLDAHKGMPHAALLVGDSTTCPCGEATTAPVHQGTFRVNTVPDLVERLDASLAAARDYLAAHPPEPEPEPEPVTDEDRRLGYRLTGNGNEDLRRMARLHAAGVPKEG